MTTREVLKVFQDNPDKEYLVGEFIKRGFPKDSISMVLRKLVKQGFLLRRKFISHYQYRLKT